MRRALLLGLLAAGGLAADAHATTFCVPDFHAACPAGDEREAVASLETAMKTDGDDNDDDRIVIDADTIIEPGEIELLLGDGDPLEIVGAGTGETTVTVTGAGPAVLDLTDGTRDVTVRDLTVRIPPSFDNGTGIVAEDDTFTGVDVESREPDANGVTAYGDVTWRGGRLFGAAGGTLWSGFDTTTGDTGDLVVEDATIEAGTGISADSADQDLTVRRSRIRATSTGVLLTDGQTALVENSVIRTAGAANAISASSNSGSGSVAGFFRHLTIAGTGIPADVPALAVAAPETNGSPNASLIVADSVVTGYAKGFFRDAGVSATMGNATLNLAYSHLPLTGTSTGDGQLSTQGAIDAAASAPLLSSELRPLAGSPLIDAGDPLTIGLATTDLLGAPRPADGNGDGDARRDIGAFEVQPTPPADPGDPGDPAPPKAPGPPPPLPAPPSPPGPGTLPARDTTAPKLSRLRFAKRVTARRGGTLNLTLSEPASVQVTFRPGGKKRALTLRFRGRAGANTFRIGKRKLRARRQQVTVVAVDGAGNRSSALRARLTVKP